MDTREADRIKSVKELPLCFQPVYNGCFRCEIIGKSASDVTYLFHSRSVCHGYKFSLPGHRLAHCMYMTRSAECGDMHLVHAMLSNSSRSVQNFRPVMGKHSLTQVLQSCSIVDFSIGVSVRWQHGRLCAYRIWQDRCSMLVYISQFHFINWFDVSGL